MQPVFLSIANDSAPGRRRVKHAIPPAGTPRCRSPVILGAALMRCASQEGTCRRTVTQVDRGSVSVGFHNTPPLSRGGEISAMAEAMMSARPGVVSIAATCAGASHRASDNSSLSTGSPSIQRAANGRITK